MGKIRTTAAAVTAALIVASCQGDSGSEESTSAAAPGAPTSSATRTAGTSTTTTKPTPSTSTSSSKPPKKTIKSVDFRNVTWTFARSGAKPTKVKLTNGKAKSPSPDHGFISYELRKTPQQGKHPTYVDADGDGDLDALVEAFTSEGNGWTIEGHVWLWDAKQEKAVQQQRPVYRDGRCGDVTSALSFDGKGAATVTYLKRESEACAEQPTRQLTRTLNTTHPTGAYQTKPWPSSLDYCNPIGGSGDFYTPQDLAPDFPGFRSAPSDNAPVVARTGGIQMWNAYERDREYKDGEWIVAWYMPKSTKLDANTDDFPCGWIKVDKGA